METIKPRNVPESQLAPSYQEAVEKSLRFYISPSPCKKKEAHRPIRYTSMRGCVDCVTVSPTKAAWHNMLHRCYNKKFPSYINYGGRGITVCEGWRLSYETFLFDMGERPEGLTLCRSDHDLPYSPQNCSWSTHQQQHRYRRSYRYLELDGRFLCLKVACRSIGISAWRVYYRVRRYGSTYQEGFDWCRQHPSRYRKITEIK